LLFLFLALASRLTDRQCEASAPDGRVAESFAGERAEIALVGREGVTPLATMTEALNHPFEFMMQVSPGTTTECAARISSELVRQANR
jgi:hypothetical protein